MLQKILILCCFQAFLFLNALHRREQKDVSVSITDNGVGMSQELIHEILTTDTASSDLFHKIGIRNIQKRMQYAYGPAYGISIQSVVGQFTKVMITIPYHTKEEKDHV